MLWLRAKLGSWPEWELVLLSAALALPGIVDWSTQAMEWRESTNLLRVVTGAAFAGGCVLAGRFLALGHLCAFAASSGLIVVQGYVALKLLQRAGAIERVLAPFEEYARICSSGEESTLHS